MEVVLLRRKVDMMGKTFSGSFVRDSRGGGGWGGTLGISRWGCAAGTLEPLTYTRASSAEFCYPIVY